MREALITERDLDEAIRKKSGDERQLVAVISGVFVPCGQDERMLRKATHRQLSIGK